MISLASFFPKKTARPQNPTASFLAGFLVLAHFYFEILRNRGHCAVKGAFADVGQNFWTFCVQFTFSAPYRVAVAVYPWNTVDFQRGHREVGTHSRDPGLYLPQNLAQTTGFWGGI